MIKAIVNFISFKISIFKVNRIKKNWKKLLILNKQKDKLFEDLNFFQTLNKELIFFDTSKVSKEYINKKEEKINSKVNKLQDEISKRNLKISIGLWKCKISNLDGYSKFLLKCARYNYNPNKIVFLKEIYKYYIKNEQE